MSRPPRARIRDSFERAAPTYDAAAAVQRRVCARLAAGLPAAEALAALIPGARLATFADCAHAPFISRPEEFRERVQAFLNE